VKKLILMQGAPGCGKSTLAEALAQHYENTTPGPLPKTAIRSADLYWYTQVEPEKPDVYSWHPEWRGRAHRWAQMEVLRDMQAAIPVIIVDNTNTTRKEALPYRVMANTFDYEVEVIRVDPGVEVCVARQADRPEDRRVPEEVVRAMHARMQDLIPDESEFYPLSDYIEPTIEPGSSS
jgi:predicted kinase